MKIIFLDVDGVVNTARWMMQQRFSKWGRFKIWLQNKRWKFLCLFPLLRDWYQENFSSWNEDKFDLYSIYWINQLLKDIPDLQLVISSVWKCVGLTGIKAIFQQAGVDSSRIISCTPSVDSFRGKEIKAWIEGLEANPLIPAKKRWDWNSTNEQNTPHFYSLEVQSYVCVDDDGDFFPDQNLVQTNSHDGFGYEHYLKVRKLFGITDKWDRS